MPVRQLLLLPQIKYLLHGVLALPFVWLIWALFHDALGANPAGALSRATGDWTLRLLCVVLAVTPLRRLTGLSELIRFRRSIGLACFYYACLHLLCYAWFDQSFEVNEMAKDLVKRPFIWLGMICFVLMLPLALTSHNAAVRWLGGKRWQQLHKWVYVLPVFALLHFYWMRTGKNNFTEVWVYLAILSGLLLSRLWFKLNKIRIG